MKIVLAVSGVPIRLSSERLSHIYRRHIEMRNQEEKILETVSSPDFVQEVDAGTLLAVKHYDKTPLTRKFCAVVYKEINKYDGFVITAYFTSRPSKERKIIWKP